MEKELMSSQFLSLARSSLIDELSQLRASINDYTEILSESEFWTKPLEPGNSVGHLVLHLTGNLNHFVGTQLGGSGYLRDREREFAESNPPSKAKALADLDAAVATFRRVVENLTEEQMLAPHPEARFGPVFKALVHLLSHFALHRGQMSYIVRMVKK
jgi:uncharacterized damage-inducible protein DinB